MRYGHAGLQPLSVDFIKNAIISVIYDADTWQA
jgi:hypothetical protein